MKLKLLCMTIICVLISGVSYLVFARNTTRYVSGIIKPQQAHIPNINTRAQSKKHHKQSTHQKRRSRHAGHRGNRGYYSTFFEYPGYSEYTYDYPSYRHEPHYHSSGTTLSDKGGFPYWEVSNDSGQAVIMQMSDGTRTRISANNHKPIPVPHDKGFDFTLLSDAGQFLGNFQIVDHFVGISKVDGRITVDGSN